MGLGSRLWRSRAEPRLAAATRRGDRRAARVQRLTQRLSSYAPVSTLVLPATEVTRPRVPAVDAHSHLGRWLSPDGRWMAPDVGRLLADMDALDLTAIVNLDGRWGAELEDNLDRYDRAHPGRFATFCHVDWSLVAAHADAPARWVASLRASAAAGAAGVKVWKDLGLKVRDDAGRLLLPDDPRVADVWEACGELGLPVLWHVADPVAFFTPVDRHNERLEELLAHPEWAVDPAAQVSHGRLLEALETVLERHRGTRFVAAHLANWPENLAWLDGLLDRHPNLALDVAAREADLGRQPRAARAFLTRRADRVLWGSDIFPFDAARYRLWFRLLESEDEHFPYEAAPAPTRGRWAVYGLGLDDDVLRQLYAGTARHWIPALSS